MVGNDIFPPGAMNSACISHDVPERHRVAPLEQCPSMPDGYELTDRPDADMLEQVYRLRVLAWQDQLKLPPDFTRWTDRWDAVSTHWCVLHGETVVGAFRFSLHDSFADAPDGHMFDGLVEWQGRCAVASLLVIHPDHRGRRLAAPLDFLASRAPGWSGATIVFTSFGNVADYSARLPAVTRAGWRLAGPARGISRKPYGTGRLADVMIIRYEQDG